jgi:menaquinol-cytochrome c reductase iron-sulfur subunit
VDDIPLAPEPPKRGTAYPGAKPPGYAGHGSGRPEPPRRNFLVGFFAAVIGGIVGLIPFAAGLVTYLDPIRRTKVGDKAIPLTTLDVIPDASEGTVLIGQFPVINDRSDAWNLYPNERVGSVYLVVPKGTKEVKALNTVCPHLGCAVDTQKTDGGGTKFYCPCHTSSFSLDGERILPCVAPRAMDELECKLEPVGDDGRVNVSVVYKNFLPGLAEKKEKS